MSKAEHPKPPIDCGYLQCPVEFLTELLERLVDAQVKQSGSMGEISTNNSELFEKIAWIKSQFTNGFRSEIKNHITQVVVAHNQGTVEFLEKIDKKMDRALAEVNSLKERIDTYRQPKFWAKVLVAALFFVGSAIFTFNSVYDIVQKYAGQDIRAVDSKNADQLKKNNELLQKLFHEGGKDGHSSSRPGE